MEEVLGRVPPSSQETSSLAAETRLLRVQTQELVKEIRMLRESLQQRKAAQAGSAQPAAAPAAVSPAVAPAPAVAPTPVRAEPPAAPAPPPPIKAPVATPPVSASASTATAEPVTSTIAKVVSAGWGDGNVADFLLNGRKIDIRGEAGRRGLNVVTIDPDTQQVMSRKTYDVWADPQTENTRLAADINSLPDGRVILVACKDSGMENLDARAIAALWSAGATVPGGKEREGYALIGIKGSEALAEEQGGRVEIEGELPFFVRHPPPLPPSSPSPPPMPVASQPQQFSPPTWAKEPAAPKPPSTFPTAPPTAEPAQKVRVPKLQVDPQGGVTYQDEMVERDGKPEEQGQSWQEVVLMLDKLQAKIKAHFALHWHTAHPQQISQAVRKSRSDLRVLDCQVNLLDLFGDGDRSLTCHKSLQKTVRRWQLTPKSVLAEIAAFCTSLPGPNSFPGPHVFLFAYRYWRLFVYLLAAFFSPLLFCFSRLWASDDASPEFAEPQPAVIPQASREVRAVPAAVHLQPAQASDGTTCDSGRNEIGEMAVVPETVPRTDGVLLEAMRRLERQAAQLELELMALKRNEVMCFQLSDVSSHEQAPAAVYLGYYDISNGTAQRLLGLEAVWHTAVIVHWPHMRSELYFDGNVRASDPGSSPFGKPEKVEFVGHTARSPEEVLQCLTRCQAEFAVYNLWTQNCNHFSNKMLSFLCDQQLPVEILDQPTAVWRKVPLLLRPLLRCLTCRHGPPPVARQAGGRSPRWGYIPR
ncbi:DESI1 [Symbiodinium natans]|uniref:DESI1 protein n=1 Tax=Symbiodinium natans TaxID=878477 RepID=A0A812KXJ4_9DINO|nr:DESI1 [Symbiodinium natans]